MDMGFYLSSLTNAEMYRMNGKLPERRIEELIDQEEYTKNLKEGVEDYLQELKAAYDFQLNSYRYLKFLLESYAGEIESTLKILQKKANETNEERDELLVLEGVAKDLKGIADAEFIDLNPECIKESIQGLESKLKDC